MTTFVVLSLTLFAFGAGWFSRHLARRLYEPVPPTDWACCMAALSHLYDEYRSPSRLARRYEQGSIAGPEA